MRNGSKIARIKLCVRAGSKRATYLKNLSTTASNRVGYSPWAHNGNENCKRLWYTNHNPVQIVHPFLCVASTYLQFDLSLITNTHTLYSISLRLVVVCAYCFRNFCYTSFTLAFNLYNYASEFPPFLTHKITLFLFPSRVPCMVW